MISVRLLFTMDAKNYAPNGTVFSRPSVRAVIRRSGKVAMVHSLKYGYYKFPGGGMEPGETQMNALCRETLEEAGLVVNRESVLDYGYVHRIEKGDQEEVFVQDNFYYLCDVLPVVKSQNLDAYEAEERFTLEWVEPSEAITANRTSAYAAKEHAMLEREARVLEYLILEGLL